MNIGAVESIANAVLYEGYLLYPYRQSALKNRQRFNFGVLYPQTCAEVQGGFETHESRTECLIESKPTAEIEAKVRFLQLVECDGRQEGHERTVCSAPVTLETLTSSPVSQSFRFGDAAIALEGELSLSAAPVAKSVFQLTVAVRNLSHIATGNSSRDELLLRSLVSVHSILQVTGGEFISMQDPPADCKAAAAECRSAGAWPILVGEPGQRNLLLCSPIILSDYPEVAPESPGDLFDSAEIDEILALRILTMTDAEKLEIRNGDDRARRILERTEMLPPEHFQKLHGAMRGLRPRLEPTA